MIEEVINTSAPRGLSAGSRGFCVVAATQGMSNALIERVESLSGYRYYFDSTGSQSLLNRPCFSHLLLKGAGGNRSLLSRIAPAPADYSGRTNRLAHHIIVPIDERPPAGPALTASTPGVFTTQWTGDPRTLAPNRRLPITAPQNAAPCHAWEKATGDAGWAGRLLELIDPVLAKPVFIICPNDVDPLILMTEVCNLLPPESRWQVTFSTCYGGDLGPDTVCQFRFLPATPDAVRIALAAFGAIVLDLVALRSEAAPSSAAAAAARLGELYGGTSAASVKAILRPAQPQPARVASVLTESLPLPGEEDVIVLQAESYTPPVPSESISRGQSVARGTGSHRGGNAPNGTSLLLTITLCTLSFAMGGLVVLIATLAYDRTKADSTPSSIAGAGASVEIPGKLPDNTAKVPPREPGSTPNGEKGLDAGHPMKNVDPTKPGANQNGDQTTAPPVVLNESTPALDTEAKKLAESNFKRLLAGVTQLLANLVDAKKARVAAIKEENKPARPIENGKSATAEAKPIGWIIPVAKTLDQTASSTFTVDSDVAGEIRVPEEFEVEEHLAMQCLWPNSVELASENGKIIIRKKRQYDPGMQKLATVWIAKAINPPDSKANRSFYIQWELTASDKSIYPINLVLQNAQGQTLKLNLKLKQGIR